MSTAETRTVALQFAVDWAGDRARARRFHPSASEVIDVAEEFADYIDNGTVPVRTIGRRPAGDAVEYAVTENKVYDPETGTPVPFAEARQRGLLDTSTVPKPGPRPTPSTVSAVAR